jgi:hypothetical protein
MAAGSGIRIGDAEREAAATNLREHYARGRLTLDEFQQRLDAVFAAKTDLDLAKLTSDLPLTNPYAAPWPPAQPTGSAGSAGSARPSPAYAIGSGRRAGRTAGAKSFAWVSMSLVLLALCLFAFSWPFGGPVRIFLLVLAVFGFARRILRRIMGGGRRWR